MCYTKGKHCIEVNITFAALVANHKLYIKSGSLFGCHLICRDNTNAIVSTLLHAIALSCALIIDIQFGFINITLLL